MQSDRLPEAGLEDSLIRSFIAVEIPDDIKDEIERLIGRFRAGHHPVKWVSRPNLHLTLAFLGENPVEFVNQAKDVLERVALAAPGFGMSLKDLGAFPNERAARVIWLGVDQGAPELVNLALRVQNELARIGFLPDRRPFSAHLTIGRVRERIADMTPILSRTYASRAFAVKRMALIRSILQPSGPVYDELAGFNLQPVGG